MSGNINEASRVAGQRRRRGRGAGLVIGLLACSAVVWQSSHAAFSSTTDNNGNVLGAGTVTITDNDGGVTKLFNLPNLAPGATGSVCMGVSYTGSLTPTAIKTYLPIASASESNAGAAYAAWANTAASEMDDNTTLQIEVNSADLAADPGTSCAPVGVGTFSDVVAATTLKTLINTNNTYASGLTAPTIAQNQWRVFRFTYNFSSAAPNTAQGDGIQFGVTWEAQR